MFCLLFLFYVILISSSLIGVFNLGKNDFGSRKEVIKTVFGLLVLTQSKMGYLF
jgi:hypothetical protein